MSNTIKRYRLARPGDEGRECWCADSSKEIAIGYAMRAGSVAYKIDGFYKGNPVFLRRDGTLLTWNFCIVADEAPAPGEGYRLLKKMEYDGEEEEVISGDEWWDGGFEMWKPVNSRYAFPCTQKSKNHYRRRIEPEKPAWTPKVGDWVTIKFEMEMNYVFISYPQLVTAIRDEECHINGAWVSMDKCSPAEPPQQQPTGTPSVATGTELRVCQDIAARQAEGIAKYGTTVESNGLPLRAWLEHAYQEALDSAVYLRRAMEEMDKQTKGELTE